MPVVGSLTQPLLLSSQVEQFPMALVYGTPPTTRPSGGHGSRPLNSSELDLVPLGLARLNQHLRIGNPTTD
jgi:hypothetical protein